MTCPEFSANDEMALLRVAAYQVIAPIILITGFLGNSLNLYVLIHLSINYHTKSYLIALTTTDLFVLLFEIPMVVRLHDLLKVSQPVAYFYAHFELVLLNSCIATSIFIVLCLTVERYKSVCLRNLFASPQSNKKTLAYLSACLLCATVVSVPLSMLKTVCKLNNGWSIKENRSITERSFWYAYLAISEGVVRLVPSLIIAVLNVLIIKKFRSLQKRRKNMLRTCCLLKGKRLYEEKRLVVLLQANVILFFVTMIPSACLSFLYQNYGEKEFRFQVFRAVANILELCHSAFNFGFYLLRSSEIRGRVKEILVNAFTGRNQEGLKSDCGDVTEGVYRATMTST